LLRVAVAGTGWVGKEYLECVTNNPDTELRAIVTRNLESAQSRVRSWGFDAPVTDSFEEVVRDPLVDAIILCSTPDIRPEQVILAAQHGKHLVIEKPVSLDSESLRQMVEAVAKAEVKTAVSFVLRWNPLFDIIKTTINDGHLGRIFMAEIDYWHNVGPHLVQYDWTIKKKTGGSTMLAGGCHAVDALRYFAGEVEEVTAYSGQTFTETDYEFDPNVIAVMRLNNGGIAKVAATMQCKTPYKFNIRLLGDKGTVVDNKIYMEKFKGQTDYATIPTIMPDSGDVSHHPFKDEIEDFVRAIKTGTDTRCTLADAANTMEICFAIDKSAETGKPVKVLSYEKQPTIQEDL
jgi:UDP-N-acetyl-2-amino-2-deoxyglucuronate dehydrogenase